MPRSARWVVPGAAHHVTQRGTNRQIVFYSRRDRRVYLHQLTRNASAEGVRILAYCLMDNHIHLIVVPPAPDSLAVVLRRTHGRYAQYFNARKGRSGHLWQNRFYSCPMDEHHLWAALRYVERNPVRAGLTPAAGAWAWSSAAAHLGEAAPLAGLDLAFWRESGGAERWSELLAEPDEEAWLQRFRRATYAGNPLGTDEFVERVKAGQAMPGDPLASTPTINLATSVR
jgi:putative transposase